MLSKNAARKEVTLLRRFGVRGSVGWMTIEDRGIW
jgi:hypothetical protein